MYKYNIHPLNWYRTAFDSFFSSAKVQYFVLPMVQVGSYWVFLSYCGIILQSLANWTGHSLANWTGQSVAYWIGHSVAYWIEQSVRNWIEQSVRNWIEHSVDNRIGLWVSEILHDGSHLFRSQVDLMPVRDIKFIQCLHRCAQQTLRETLHRRTTGTSMLVRYYIANLWYLSLWFFTSSALGSLENKPLEEMLRNCSPSCVRYFKAQFGLYQLIQYTRIAHRLYPFFLFFFVFQTFQSGNR